MSFPGLSPTRARVLAALVQLCSHEPDEAARHLGLGPTQDADVALNTTLLSRSCAPAVRVYSGVLFDALDYPTISAKAKRRAQARVAISSGLWGLVRPTDLIPAYRLSGGVRLPGIGTLASAWREPLAAEIEASVGPIIDLRSSTYAALGPITAAAQSRSVVVRVLQERAGRRTVVSHMNKATKGRILRALLESDERVTSASDLVAALHGWGYRAELGGGRSATIDVVVTEL